MNLSDLPLSEQRKLARHALWRSGELDWLLWPQQKVIYDEIRAMPASAGLCVMLCARQFGKSVLSTLLALEDCIRYPNTTNLIIGPTEKQTRAIVAPRIKLLSKTAPDGLISPTKSESKWVVGSSELYIGGFDSKNATAQRGKTLKNIHIEEIVDADPDQYMTSMRSDLAPAMLHSKNGQMRFFTTLPKIPDHPFIVDTMATAEELGTLHVYTIDDNAALDAEQKEKALRLAGGVNSPDARREYFCELVRDETRMVIPDYNEALHVGEVNYPRAGVAQLTIDLGGVRDKTAGTFGWYDFYNAKYVIRDELVFDSNTPTEKIMDEYRRIMDEHGKHFTRVDICIDAPGQWLVDFCEMHGVRAKMPPKDDWQAAVNQMAVKFLNNNVIIHPKCEFLRKSCRSGVFNKNRTDFDRTTTLGHMDALAALMYHLRTQDTSNPYRAEPESSGQFYTPHHREKYKKRDVVDAVNKTNFVHKYGTARRLGTYKN